MAKVWFVACRNNARSLHCRLDHTVLRCRGGDVWVSGYNRCGQLGLGRDTSFVGSFVRVKCPPVRHVSAGPSYTLLVRFNIR